MGGVILAALGIGTLAGCAASPEARAASDPIPRPAVPDFSGPFAAEYAEARSEADSDFMRAIVEDEKVSEDEWTQVESRVTSCFTEAGARFEGHDEDGGYAASKNELSSERMNEVMAACEISSGEHPIGYLWFSAQKNPQHLPWESIISECLIRNGVVAPGYTAQDFLEDNPTMSFPYLDPNTGPERFLACNNDPRTGS